MGADALKELIASDITQQPVKQDEPVDGVGGAVSDQSVEKKQEDYDKGNTVIFKLCHQRFGFRARRNVANEEEKNAEEETNGYDHHRASIRGKDHVN